MVKRRSVSSTSFMNLFPSFVYDKNQVPDISLDIWNAFRIKIFGNIPSDKAFIFYQLKGEESYPEMSTFFYDTPTLWWLIPLANDAEDPFTFLDDAKLDNDGIIKVLKQEYVDRILSDMRVIRERNEARNVRDNRS